jgi:hypothetical protein
MCLFFTFDQLIRLEYNSYKAQWENDGRPRGIFWFPPEYWRKQNASWFGRWKSQYKNEWAFQKVALFWVFSTPQWIKDDEKAKNLIRRLRILFLIWNGSLLLGFVSIMFIGMQR